MYNGKWGGGEAQGIGGNFENGLISDGDTRWPHKISCPVKKKLSYNLVNNNLSWKINGANISKGATLYLK